MLRALLTGLLLGAIALAGCSQRLRYDVQLQLDLAQQQSVEARSEQHGWLHVIYRRHEGPWIETEHAFAVGKRDLLSIKRDGQTVNVSAGTHQLWLSQFDTDSDTVALAFRRTSGNPLAPLAELSLLTVQVVAISVAAVAVLVIVLVLEGDDDDEHHRL